VRQLLIMFWLQQGRKISRNNRALKDGET